MFSLIPGLPLAAVLLNLLLGDRLGKRGTAWLSCGAVGLAFAFALRAVVHLAGMPEAERSITETLYTWIQVGDLKVDVAWLLDPLSSVMILVVTGVGFLIHVYSVGYMSHDPSFRRFFLYLNLFTFAMLTLVLADNFLLMFVGWEGVGLCSYLLIGFWYERPSAAEAGKKAFIVNRIGDFGFILGILFLFAAGGSLQYERLFAVAPYVFAVGSTVVTTATLLLFLGATGKSAQLPLYTWLPDAMEGPTPVSALIHAATMVTAGVYMVARTHVLFQLAPFTLHTVAVVGAATALFAATIALAQNDIKRVLAYSTISQLGYMFLALGVGAFAAGVFHVFTHAFFKALLFLGAGSVIHAMSGEQDMRNMGDLAKRIPITHWTMFFATLAIAGIPGFAGFFSKDEILWQSWAKDSSAYHVLWIIGWVTAAMTALYMFRLMYLTFHGRPRMDHEVEHHIHESPRSMTWPLIILAFFSIFAGYLGLPRSLGGSDRFGEFLKPVFAPEVKVLEAQAPAQAAAGEKEAEHTSGTEYTLMFLSVAVAFGGWGLAWKFYRHADRGYVEPIAAVAPPAYQLLLNKYYVDEGYDYLFTGRRTLGPVRLGAMGLGEATSDFDKYVIDGAVNGAGWSTRAIGTLSRLWDTYVIDGVFVNGPAVVSKILSYPARLLQWGLVQWYALVMVAGLLGFVAYYAWR